jgi:hypothetical protein
MRTKEKRCYFTIGRYMGILQLVHKYSLMTSNDAVIIDDTSSSSLSSSPSIESD